MAMPRKFTSTQEAEIIERYVSGEPLNALGAAYNVSPATIRNILLRYNIGLRARGAEKQYTAAELAEHASQARQRWYQNQKQQGLCVHCRSGIALPGTTSCEQCREVQREAKTTRTEAGYVKQWYEG